MVESAKDAEVTRRDLRDVDEMTRAGGQGLPPAGPGDTVWLFTCRDCGRRWADTPGPVAGCSCGSESIVCHRIDRERYNRIRHVGDPRP